MHVLYMYLLLLFIFILIFFLRLFLVTVAAHIHGTIRLANQRRPSMMVLWRLLA